MTRVTKHLEAVDNALDAMATDPTVTHEQLLEALMDIAQRCTYSVTILERDSGDPKSPHLTMKSRSCG